MISDKYNCFFFHIPRTGGTSIEHWLANRQRLRYRSFSPEHWIGFDRRHNMFMQHCTPNEARSHPDAPISKLNTYFRFTFVRHPHERLLSVWHAEKLRYLERYGSWIGFLEHLKELSMGHRDDPSLVALQPQSHYVIHNGKLQVDFVGRFESYRQDTKLLSKLFGITRHIEFKNPLASTKRDDSMHYSAWFDDESANIVSEVYQQDMTLLGYEFNRLQHFEGDP